MKDIIRTLNKLEPALRDTGRFGLVEISPRLRAVQAATLRGMEGLSWHADIDELPDGPLFIVGNELFDAVPLRQYVKARGLWRERCVGLDSQENLIFVAGAGSLEPVLLPGEAEAAAEGAIVELAPARTALMQKIAERIARVGGAGLFIDYGYARPALGDTLQAVRAHAYADVLAQPGEADLTAHVDFAALAAVARACGLDASLMEQGEFLISMGLLERAGALGANADDAQRERIRGEVERLAGDNAMGVLFKVLILGRPGMPLPPASAAS